MKLGSLGLLALLALCVSVRATESSTGSDRLLYQCPIRAGDAAIGEVRLLTRQDHTILEVLLQAVPMRRVVAEIRKKEESNWPPTRSGAPSSQRYVAALEKIQRQLWQQRARSARGPNPPQRLRITFVAAPDGSWVTLGSFEARGEPPSLEVLETTPIERLDLEPYYVHENIRLILADTCGLDLGKVENLLASTLQAPPAPSTRPTAAASP
ncbi:MAG: hypothetical protein KatS3mg077_2541 [Candidatus Binatia bacterium]|nr:MAG: hypothetical protein KatS3mg077_2541 [Candidatus Binatia bacterium]